MPNAFMLTAPVRDILGSLKSLSTRDKVIEAEAKRTGRNAGWWWAGVVVFGLVFFFTIGGFTGLGLFFLALALTCLGFAIYWSVQTSNWKKQDMEDRRITLAQQFFGVLGNDVPTKQRCMVSISFDDYRTHGKLLEQQKAGLFGSLRMFKYEDGWFVARGRLYDGNRFKVTVTQQVHRKEKSKRKYTKVRERIAEEVTLMLQLSQETYPLWSNLSNLLQPGPANDTYITRVSVQNGLLRVSAETPECQRTKGRYGTQEQGSENLASGDTLLKLFIHVYDKLQLCRAEQMGRPAPSTP